MAAAIATPKPFSLISASAPKLQSLPRNFFAASPANSLNFQKNQQDVSCFYWTPLEKVQQYTERDRFFSASEALEFGLINGCRKQNTNLTAVDKQQLQKFSSQTGNVFIAQS